MIYPVNKQKITSSFGMRTLKDNKGITTTKFHSGVDFAPEQQGIPNDSVLSVLDGKVFSVGYDSDGYGKYIILIHDDYMTLYAHLMTSLVTVDEIVSKGHKIGLMGNTGHCVGSGLYPGTHLHFEVRDIVTTDAKKFFSNEKDGRKYKAIDPMTVIAKEEFKEVKEVEKTKYEIEIEKAIKYVIENGISDGTNGNKPVTREQLWVMLHRLSELNS